MSPWLGPGAAPGGARHTTSRAAALHELLETFAKMLELPGGAWDNRHMLRSILDLLAEQHPFHNPM